jgi:hypothetical protein
MFYRALLGKPPLVPTPFANFPIDESLETI